MKVNPRNLKKYGISTIRKVDCPISATNGKHVIDVITELAKENCVEVEQINIRIQSDYDNEYALDCAYIEASVWVPKNEAELQIELDRVVEEYNKEAKLEAERLEKEIVRREKELEKLKKNLKN